MKICVCGLWHLGSVIAACLANAGHDVIGLDFDAPTIDSLRSGKPPLYEPGLKELIVTGLASGRLHFENDLSRALAAADVVWITFDTPVDEDDVPQVLAVTDPVEALFPALPNSCLVLVSSQVPVGTTRQLSDAALNSGRTDVTFGYSPENLRLGRAIEVFTKPDRVVVGLQSLQDRDKVSALLAPFTQNIVWTGIEAAEMIKHAINAFLATSVTFMNEIGAICERVGADAKEVERGLKSEQRIGPSAYLSPGAAFAGGTLARDVNTLADLDARLMLPGVLFAAVRESNERHRSWPLRKLKERFSTIENRQIAILGLTYKVGTDTLRRSSAVELAVALRNEGASVVAFDPVIKLLPDEHVRNIKLAASAADALRDTDAVVIATPWPEFRELPWPNLLSVMRSRVVIDANWVLASSLGHFSNVAYTAVGLPWTSH